MISLKVSQLYVIAYFLQSQELLQYTRIQGSIKIRAMLQVSSIAELGNVKNGHLKKNLKRHVNKKNSGHIYGFNSH